MARAGRVQREETMDVLSQALTDGRIDLGEFTERSEKAAEAKTVQELRDLVVDLPVFPVEEYKVRDHLPMGVYDRWTKEAKREIERSSKLQSAYWAVILPIIFVIAPIMGYFMYDKTEGGTAVAIAMSFGIALVVGVITAIAVVLHIIDIRNNNEQMSVLLQYIKSKMEAILGSNNTENK